MEHIGSYLSLGFSFGDTSEPDILGDNTIANHTTCFYDHRNHESSKLTFSRNDGLVFSLSKQPSFIQLFHSAVTMASTGVAKRVFSALFYAGCSFSIVVINKLVLTSYK